MGKTATIVVGGSATGLKEALVSTFGFPRDRPLRAKLLKEGDQRHGKVLEIVADMDLFDDIPDPVFEIEKPPECMRIWRFISLFTLVQWRRSCQRLPQPEKKTFQYLCPILRA